MTKRYYIKNTDLSLRIKMRLFGFILFLTGITGLVYIFFPIISWQIYIAPILSSSTLASPIPKAAILTSSSLQSLLKNRISIFSSVDYSNAANWFPTSPVTHFLLNRRVFYLSIPRLGLSNAIVSAGDNDLNKHLVNFNGTAYPPAKGNAVVFGHSTLPQLFDPHNYKTIFATLHTLKLGDKLVITENGVSYIYLIDSVSIVGPDDTTPLEQQYDASYLTLITCTPPGTTWQRLIIHSRLAKLS